MSQTPNILVTFFINGEQCSQSLRTSTLSKDCASVNSIITIAVNEYLKYNNKKGYLSITKIEVYEIDSNDNRLIIAKQEKYADDELLIELVRDNDVIG